jgi:hypothetical protein
MGFLIPNKENNFCPKIIKGGFLVFYLALVLFVVALTPPFSEIKLDKLFAQLTQENILLQVNPVRQEEGILELRVNKKLERAAKLKAEDMINRGYFSHMDPDGQKPWVWLERENYDYAAAGENLAIDFYEPKDVVFAWLNSPTHAKNILNSYFTDIGIGVAKGKINGQEAIVVVMFLGKEMTPNLQSAVMKKPQVILATASPDKLIVETKVDEKILEKENLILSNNGNFLPKIESYNQKSTEVKFFIASNLIYKIRLVLTIFFSILILWALVTLTVKKEKPFLRIFNSFFILIFIFSLWLPEIL